MENLEMILEELVAATAGASVVSSIASLFGNVLSLAVFVLTGYGLYAIAQRRGLKNPWLAWVPAVQNWTLGAISDDYHSRTTGKKKNKRKVMIGLLIAQAVLVIALTVAAFVVILLVIGTGYSESDVSWSGAIGGVVALVVLCVAFCGVSIALTVIRYIALYDVYRSCDPENASLYVVLNVLFAITVPIFLLIVHKKDGGIPVAAQIPQPEPWVNP